MHLLRSLFDTLGLIELLCQKMNLVAIYALCSLSLLSLVRSQNWSKVPKWANFGLYGALGFKDLDFKLEFMMDNYEIISLEKCIREDNTEHVSVSMAKPLVCYN